MKNWILCMIACLVAGCGSGGGPENTTVEQDVYAHVMGLGDSCSSEKMFQAAFVSGAAPQNRKDYGKYVYLIDGTAEIDGDEATVPVKIIAGMVASPGGTQGKPADQTETKMTWKLQREGEEWKIKEAPLPG